jgi:hypothetical protein
LNYGFSIRSACVAFALITCDFYAAVLQHRIHPHRSQQAPCFYLDLEDSNGLMCGPVGRQDEIFLQGGLDYRGLGHPCSFGLVLLRVQPSESSVVVGLLFVFTIPLIQQMHFFPYVGLHMLLIPSLVFHNTVGVIQMHSSRTDQIGLLASL